MSPTVMDACAELDCATSSIVVTSWAIRHAVPEHESSVVAVYIRMPASKAGVSLHTALLLLALGMLHARLCMADSVLPARLTCTAYCLVVCVSGAVTVMVMVVAWPAVRLTAPLATPLCNVLVLTESETSYSMVMVLAAWVGTAVRVMEVTECATGME